MELRSEKIAYLSDAEFKTLVIRVLAEIVEHGHKIEEKVKAMKSEMKRNVQGTKVKGRKPRLKSTGCTKRKKETFNQNRMKKQEFLKMRRATGTSRTSLNITTSEL